MQLEIPQDIIDILHDTQYVHDEYFEFGIDVSVSREGEVRVRDMLGTWQGSNYATDMKPEVAWETIRKWWANEQENLSAQGEKAKIEEQIVALQTKLKGLEERAKKKKWLWW